MNHANLTAGLSPPPDPPKDRRGEAVPEGIAAVLTVLRILLAYGNHLLATLELRAFQRSFATIAQCFGTARLPVIIARLTRGIRRAMALQRVLLARAASGNDLVPEPPASYRPSRERSSAAANGRPRNTSDPAVRPDPEEQPDLDTIPTIAQLEAEIRDQSVGQVIADICRDLGVSPFRCEQRFAAALHDAITRYGGNHLDLCGDMLNRKIDLLAELERIRDPDLDWPKNDDPDTVRRVVGFFVGEEPVCPFPAAVSPGSVEAVAAAPP